MFVLPDTSKNLDEVTKRAKTAKLTLIDCTNPNTPKPKKVAALFVSEYLRIPEPTAWQAGSRLGWDLGAILNLMYCWTRLTTAQLSETQITNLLDTLAPVDPKDVFTNAIVERKHHKVDVGSLVGEELVDVFRNLATTLNKLRILKEVLGNVQNNQLASKTGLSAADLTRLTPIAKNLTVQQITRWGDAVQWAFTHRDQPHILTALVGLLAV